MAYASRTGTRRNLDALRAAGWRLMISPAGVLRTEGFAYALDNGAWSAFQAGQPFDVPAFKAALARFGAGADFVVVPDIVAGGRASLDLSLEWLPRVLARTRLALIAVQDGMTEADVEPHLGPRVGLFVGGSTEWKVKTIRAWGALGRRVGCYVHVGRVNSARRIGLCVSADVDSFDGSSVSRFAVTLPRLDLARRQSGLFGRSPAPAAPREEKP